jgi:hypothetical protein
VDGSFEVARNDPAFASFGQEEALALGSMIVIEREGLRPWVGFVQKPNWNLKRPTVSVPVKQDVRVLAERTLPKGFTITGFSGEIFRRCVEAVNLLNPMFIFACSSPEPGPTLSLDLSEKTLFAALNEMADAAGMEWWLDAVVTPSGVTMTLYWSSQRGSDLSGQLYLREGENLTDGDYTLDETQLAVEVTMIGGASAAGGMALRPSARASLLPASAGAAGQQELTLPDEVAAVTDVQRARIEPWTGNPASKRQVALVRPTTTDQATITTGAGHTLDKQYRGPEELSCVVPITDPILPKFWLGDVLTYYAPSLGPNGIEKRFRVSEIIPSDTEAALAGRADGGLLRPKYAALQELKNDVENLKRQPTPGTTTALTIQQGGGGGGSAGPTALDDLTDVDAPAPDDEDVLTFDTATGKWIAAPPAGGGKVTHIVCFGQEGNLLSGVLSPRRLRLAAAGEHGAYAALRVLCTAGTAGTGTNTIVLEAHVDKDFGAGTATLYTIALDTNASMEVTTAPSPAWAAGDIYIRARCSAVGATAPINVEVEFYFTEAVW